VRALSIALLTACGPASLPPSLDAATDAQGSDAAARDAAMRDASAPSGFDPAVWRRSVIYFVLTDRFDDGDSSNNGDPICYDPAAPNLFHGGDFAGLEARLDYFEALGVDTLWITPIAQQSPRRGDACGYHGYWADLADPHERAIDSHLGTDAELDRLIAALHARDMKLIVDMVVNHPARNARIVEQHPDWFHPQEGCEALGPADIYCSLSGLPDFAHEDPIVADYLDAMSRSWLERFEFDGIRMDTVKHVPVEYFADRFIPLAREENPRLYLLGEIFDAGSYDLQLRYRTAGFHGFFDFPLRDALIQTFAHGGSANAVAARVQEAIDRFGLDGALLRSTFVDNHDVPRFLTEFRGGTDADRMARFRLALGVIFTTPGIPQLYYGTELGMSGLPPENRRDMPDWAFDATARSQAHDGFPPDPSETFEFVQRLIAVRRDHPALHAGGYAEMWRPGGLPSNVYAFFRSSGESRAIVAVNAGDAMATNLRMQFRDNPGISAEDKAAIEDGTAFDELLGTTGASAALDEGRFTLTLPPRSMAIWVPR
jgi:alpha-amylase